MKIKTIMTQKVFTVSPDSTVAEASILIFKYNLSGLPVVDEGNYVVGIVTEYDIMSKPLKVNIPIYINLLETVGAETGNTKVQDEVEAIRRTTVGEIMTVPVVTIAPDEEIAVAARIFSEQRINPLPVVDKKNKLVGIVSRADIVKLFC